MLKPLVFAQVLTLLAFTGCATARYEWNLAHEHLSANVRQIPLAEIQQITRLVSEKCGEPIICIHRIDSGPYAGEI